MKLSYETTPIGGQVANLPPAFYIVAYRMPVGIIG